MRIMAGLKKKGSPAVIPNCTRDGFPEFFKEMGFKVGAEIGVLYGDFTEKFCRVGLQMYAIDPWLASPDHLERNPIYQKKKNAIYRRATEKLALFDNCKIIRKTSMDAVSDFKDGSLDFVYIDGNHWFRYFAEDIFEWPRKVRKGGVISGHDYCSDNAKSQVLYVVDAYTKAFEISQWYVTNFKDEKPSWFWIKG